MADRADLKTLVLLCADLATLGHGLDLEEMRNWLQEKVPAVHVQFVPNLDRRPADLTRVVAASGAVRLVLGLCTREYAAAEVQVQARKAGLDPLGIEVVNLGAYAVLAHPRPQATDKAKILLAAAIARARAFPGSQPENVKPYLPTAVSRRSLFTLSLLEYRPVPSIQKRYCLAETGCRLCVQACPFGALQAADGQISLEKLRCESCGLCLAACPREAIQFPGYALAQLEAQLRTLLDPAMGNSERRGILFICQRAPEPVDSCHAGWMPVHLPCVGMAAPAWFLAPLLMGARAVGVLPCQGCLMGQEEAIEGRVAYCQAYLRLIGAPTELVKLSPALYQPPGEDSPVADGVWPRADGRWQMVSSTLPAIDYRLSAIGSQPLTTANVLLRLAQAYNTPSGPSLHSRACPAKSPEWRERGEGADLALEHPYSPLGIVEIREDVCTGCGMCARVCPTAALNFEQRDDNVCLTFDAALCNACGQCLLRCPEVERGAIGLKKAVDLAYLGQGRTLVYREETPRCIVCGTPIAPGKLLKRVEALLGSEYAATINRFQRYCPACRSVAPLE